MAIKGYLNHKDTEFFIVFLRASVSLWLTIK
jgi:hypothetical protein